MLASQIIANHEKLALYKIVKHVWQNRSYPRGISDALNSLVPEVWNINIFAIFFFKEGIMEKNSNDRRFYKSVDNKSLS